MHTISSFLYPPIFLHPSIFPLIPPPLLHLEGFPFLCFSALLTRERRRKILPFSLFPFLPFPTTLLPSVSAPSFHPSFPLFFLHPSPPPPPPPPSFLSFFFF